MEYKEVKEARSIPGIRLVLTVGLPGIWSQAAKKMLEYKGLSYIPVAQHVGEANADLVAWTGHRNAPVMIYDDQPAISRWQDMIAFIDALKPTPPLQPRESLARALVYGMVNEIAGEWGYGWCGRLLVFQMIASAKAAAGEELLPPMRLMFDQYKYSQDSVEAAPARCADILNMLAAQLHAQRKRGSEFLVGSELTAADIYWACFSNMLEPWPEWACDMDPKVRPKGRSLEPVILAAKDPILIEHRNMMLKKYLGPITI